MNKQYVQYGCGLSAPKEWLNFDISPTLRVQKIPILGNLIKKKLNTVFPDNVKYGDIIKGLPVEDNSCDGLYCSHTLEHLSLNDFRLALINSYRILKNGGIFRCVVPDLEWAARAYIDSLDKGDKNASLVFMKETMLGIKERPKGIKGIMSTFFGNSQHLWMWDFISLSKEIENAGFKGIRKCKFNDSQDKMFKLVENEDRFINAVTIECLK